MANELNTRPIPELPVNPSPSTSASLVGVDGGVVGLIPIDSISDKSSFVYNVESNAVTMSELINYIKAEGYIDGATMGLAFTGARLGKYVGHILTFGSNMFTFCLFDYTNLTLLVRSGGNINDTIYSSFMSATTTELGIGSGGLPMTPITYAELKALRDSGSLVSGMFYRITDYQCTTSQEGTRATDHRFDIIVQALSNYDLSEDAKADFNEDDDYFRDLDANLGGWELKYCLDNDVKRFGWVGQCITNLESALSQPGDVLVRLPDLDWSYEPANDIGYYCAWGTEADVEDGDSTNFYYSKSPILQNGDEVWRDGEFYIAEVESLGKGVIYYMKDEHGNECPYDFKNIQFKRDAQWQDDNIQVIENELCTPVGEVEWFYTFSWVTEDLEVLDTTVNQWIPGDDAYPYGTHNNKIGDYYNASFQGKSLNNNIFVSCARYDSIFYGYNRNVFDEECHDNTFFNDCSYNSIGDYCQGNMMSNFSQNNIDNDFICNYFTYFWGNKIDKGFNFNSGSYFDNNIVELQCSSNIFLDNVGSSYIGSNFFSNKVEYMDYCKVDNYIENKRISNCSFSYDENRNLIPARVTNNNYHEATVENKE